MATAISNLNADIEVIRNVGETVEREYQTVPFVARDREDPLSAQVIIGDQYFYRAKRWIRNVIADAKIKASQDPEIRNLSRYIDLVMGRHWTGSAPSWRRRPVVNKVEKFFWDNIANISDLRFAIDVRTISQEEKFRVIAEKLTELCQSNFEANDAIAAVIFCAEYASLGNGYIKITRDRDLKDVTYTPLGPDSCIEIISNPFDVQKSGGIYYRQLKPMSWYEKFHPKAYRYLRPQKPIADQTGFTDPLALGSSTYMGWSRPQGVVGVSALLNASIDMLGISPFATEEGCVYGEMHFKDSQINKTGKDLWLGYGNWTYRVRPGELIYPYGRMISFAGEQDPVILWDNTNQHWHSMYPFARLKSAPVFWMMSGMSDLRSLVAINNPFNRVLAAFLNLLEQAERPTVVTMQGSMPHEAWNAFVPGTPAGKLLLVNRLKSIMEQIQFFHPPVGVASAALSLLAFLDAQFKDQSGQGYGSRMASKKQVPGEESARLIQESEQGKYRVKSKFMELFLKDAGRLAMSDIVQYWDPDKVVSVLGPDSETWQYLEVEPGGLIPHDIRHGDFPRGYKFVNQFGVMMATGSSLPAKRREQATLAMTLMAQGRMSMRTGYKKLNAVGAGLPDPDLEIAQIIKERQLGIGIVPQKGRGGKQQAQAAIQSVPQGQ